MDNPKCLKLLDLWNAKKRASIKKHAAEEIRQLLLKDELTQKVRQSMQTIRTLWENEYPGDDTERKEQYASGPGKYFVDWKYLYDSFTDPNILLPAFQPEAMICTKNTNEKILRIMNDLSDKLRESSMYNEIYTQLTAAETYEQEIQILKAYKVLDENGVLIDD